MPIRGAWNISSADFCAGPFAGSFRASLAETFRPFAERLAADEQTIIDELVAVQGSPADIGGYYRPDPAKAEAVMRPSPTFNEALAAL